MRNRGDVRVCVVDEGAEEVQTDAEPRRVKLCHRLAQRVIAAREDLG